MSMTARAVTHVVHVLPDYFWPSRRVAGGSLLTGAFRAAGGARLGCRARDFGGPRRAGRSTQMPGTERVEITGPYGDRYDEILTPQAIDLIAALHAELGPRRSELLAARRRRQAELSGGAMLDFLPETASVREDPDWRRSEERRVGKECRAGWWRDR